MASVLRYSPLNWALCCCLDSRFLARFFEQFLCSVAVLFTSQSAPSHDLSGGTLNRFFAELKAFTVVFSFAVFDAAVSLLLNQFPKTGVLLAL